MSKTYRECAIEHLKQRNLCKGYIDYILGEIDKLEKIEQIINGSDDFIKRDADYRIAEIKEVLESEDEYE